ncbi:MAG: YncE family protein [Actinomycetes bacterium]|jgi:YVTN family beta-propeller protein
MRNRFLALILITSLCAISLPAQGEVVSADTKMQLIKTINGSISPKSVRSSGDGVVSAHNMMYNHSITVYDARTFELIKTVPDSVSLKNFGYSKSASLFKGAPVEGTYSPDGKYLYVTNYAMYGPGYNKEGHDTCSPASGFDTSFVYRINRSNYEIDAVYQVGSVPKVVEVTPDNKYLLVTNWCSYTLTVISIETQKTVKTIKIGRYPRGISVSKDSKKAYVAEMGGNRIHVINLEDFTVTFIPIGSNPRAIVLSPDNSKLYVTMNLSGQVASWDLIANQAGKSIKTGKAARSLAISSDGTALFVVNFDSDTISKVRTSDMKVLQTLKACNEPIGITFDAPTNNTWVACYKGQIKIYSNN